MEKADYRKFSHLTIFRNKTKTATLIIIMAVAGAVIGCMIEGSFSLPQFLLIWLVLIPTELAAIFLRVEYKAFKRSNLVGMGLAIVRQDLSFYDNYLIAEDNLSKGPKKIKYDNLYQALETKDYYIIYTSAENASIIRKKDIDDEDRAGFHKFLQAKMGSRYTNLIKN
jgi:hypothetical protein